MIVRHIGLMPRSQQRQIYKVLGSEKHVAVIPFEVSDVKIFDALEDGTIRNWTPLFCARRALNAAAALRHCGMEVV